MTERLSKSIMFGLVFVNLYFIDFTVEAQNGLRSLMNETISGRIKDTVVQEEPEPLVVNEDSLYTVPLESYDVKEVDTSTFVQRAVSVKKRKPVKTYTENEGWDKYFSISPSKSYKREHVLNEKFKVFGWHPHWMGSAYENYNYSLLSVIAYFSYELDPATGGYKSIHDWKTTHVIDSAHKHGTKVLLSVTNFGKSNNRSFLKNIEAQNNFINKLISLLKERNADGVNIDFEDIPEGLRDQLTYFIIDLSNRLRLEDSKYQVTIALPPIDFRHVYDFQQLNKYIDLYVIMGYEFYGVKSPIAGPVAPLESGAKWSDLTLQKALDEYKVEGIPLKKTLMGLPYYGAEWETESLKVPSKTKRFIKYPMYRDIKKRYGNELPCCEDDVSASKYYLYRNSSNEFRQLWYDDSISLSKKYDWVISNEIGGIGIWALGFDNGHDELWKLIAAKFAASKSEEMKSKFSNFFRKFSPRRMLFLGLRIMENPTYILRNPRPLMGLFGAVAGVSVLGFFVLYRYGHRISRMFGVAIKGALVLQIFVLLALIFVAMKFAGTPQVIYLLVGFVIGGIIIMIISREFLREKDLP